MTNTNFTSDLNNSDELKALEGARQAIDEISTLTCGLQGIGYELERSSNDALGFFLTTQANYLQRLRNDLAIALEPIYKAQGIESIDY